MTSTAVATAQRKAKRNAARAGIMLDELARVPGCQCPKTTCDGTLRFDEMSPEAAGRVVDLWPAKSREHAIFCPVRGCPIFYAADLHKALRDTVARWAVDDVLREARSSAAGWFPRPAEVRRVKGVRKAVKAIAEAALHVIANGAWPVVSLPHNRVQGSNIVCIPDTEVEAVQPDMAAACGTWVVVIENAEGSAR